MNLVRLTDREDDLTLKRILKISTPHCPCALVDVQTEKLDAIIELVEPIKRIRNKVLGHNDPKHLENADLPPTVTRAQIKQVIRAIGEWMNDISLELTGQRDFYDFENPVMVGDGESLVHYLRRAWLAFDEDDKRRMER